MYQKFKTKVEEEKMSAKVEKITCKPSEIDAFLTEICEKEVKDGKKGTRNFLKLQVRKHLATELSEEEDKAMRDMVNAWFDAKKEGKNTLEAIEGQPFFGTEDAPAVESTPETTVVTETPVKASNTGKKSGTTTAKAPAGAKKPAKKTGTTTNTTKKAGSKTGTKKASGGKKATPAGTDVHPLSTYKYDVMVDDSKKKPKTTAKPAAEKTSKRKIPASAVAIVLLSVICIGMFVVMLTGGGVSPFSQNGGANDTAIVEKYDAVKASTLLIATNEGVKIQLDTACTQDMQFTIDAIVGKEISILDDGNGGEVEAVYFYGVDNSVLRITYPVGKSFAVDTFLSGTVVTVTNGTFVAETKAGSFTSIPYANVG